MGRTDVMLNRILFLFVASPVSGKPETFGQKSKNPRIALWSDKGTCIICIIILPQYVLEVVFLRDTRLYEVYCEGNWNIPDAIFLLVTQREIITRTK